MSARPTRLALAALAPLLLAGCDFAPKHVRSANAAPATLPSGGTYPVADAAAPDPTHIGWQDFFTDDRLRQVIALGLANNRDLRVAAGNVLQARAQYHVQRADLLPSVSGQASATFTNSPYGISGVTGTGTTGAGAGTTTGTGTGVTTGTTTGSATTTSDTIKIYQVGLGVSAFELDLWGRVRNLTKAALDQYLATEEGSRATRIMLIGEIATAYATMAADQDQLKISEQTLKTYADTLELTRAQFRIGTSSELESRQAETNYENARNDTAVLRSQIAQDQNALNLLVGTTVPTELLPATLGAFTISDLPAGISSTLLQQRPDVLQAEDQLKAQNANIGAARAAFFPTISLTASIGTIAPQLSSLFDSGTKAWTVAPSAVLPIFDYGRNLGNLAYAKASRDVAVATYEKTLQTAFREVADALATRGTIHEQIDAQQRKAAAAEIAAKLATARYRAGVDSFLTTLDTQRTSYAAQQTLVSTRLAEASNLITLYRTLGGGLK
ncbi:efflux transporter outer membrane subunit [Sphingomonas nostoxanthinifaciens]|uniref:efflux transporter outer membrane subunit n=1 Tax=Sphingomonas nostoxanthinifaciens TaxID=2872652 RepID=UPI001CC21DB2|nr:efflux transporter outer membrane subunit [Sphingomonas nostoxanthinifaciens]UAK24026.1 efflux transporter outer membrane subunit [Sphingomonas nostoxanthinifaciens]